MTRKKSKKKGSGDAAVEPVNPNIPDNVLQQIFDEYLIDIPVLIPPRPNDERLHLMLACSRFHKLVTSTPSLWFNVYFLPDLHPQPLLLARTWLKRSAGVPVNITFRACYSLYDDKGNEVPTETPILFGRDKFSIVDDIILPCAEHIRYLHTIISTQDMIRSFLRIPPGKFSTLQQIDLILINDLKQFKSIFYQWEYDTFSVFRGLKNLRKVGYHHYNGLSPMNLHFPWTQLTEVRFETVTLDSWTFIEILYYTSTTLSRGFFSVKFTKEPRGRDGKKRGIARIREKVTSYLLRELHLYLIHPKNDDLGVLHSLRFPSVVILWIEMKENPQKWNLDSILPLICSIGQLTVFRLIHLADERKRINRLSYDPEKKMRRGLPTMSRVEEFLMLMKPLRFLTLPLSFCVHSQLLAQIVTGELLPILQHLELASLCGQEVLLMVRDRNDRAVNYQLGEGPSEYGESNDIPYAPIELARLTLYVPHEDVKELQEMAASLNKHYSCAKTEFTIRGLSHKAFYTMEKIV